MAGRFLLGCPADLLKRWHHLVSHKRQWLAGEDTVRLPWGRGRGGGNKATAGQVNIASAACLALLEPGTPKAVASRNGQQPVASSPASQRWGPLGLNSFSWAFYLHTSLEWTPKRFSNVSWAANFPCDLFCWGPNPSQRLHAMKASAGHRPRRQG